MSDVNKRFVFWPPPTLFSKFLFGILFLNQKMSQHPSRGGDGSSDSEDDSTGHAPNQVLPVANLPFDFDGIPRDGMEYLFTVRFSSFFLPFDCPSPLSFPSSPQLEDGKTGLLTSLLQA